MDELKDTDFQEKVLNESLPVMIDFWAEWCGPCKAMTPILEEIAEEYNGKIKIMKMNVEENQNIPQQYGIISIPALLIFKDGSLAETLIGAMSKDKVLEAINKYI